MWQLNWMMEILPSWIWSPLLVLGTIGFLLGWFLNKIPYALPVKIISFILIVLSIRNLGATSNEEKWQAKVKELEGKIAVAEQQSQQATKDVEFHVVEKVRYVRGKTEYLTKYITEYVDREVVKKEEVIKYVENCPLPKEIIEIHNAAAELNRNDGVMKK